MNGSLNDLIDVLTELRGEPRGSISPKTKLYEDLQIQGDDWNDVLEAVNSRWKVSWTGFTAKDYFREEPNLFSIFLELERRLTGKKMKDMTVGHLASVIDKGEWFETRE